MDEAERVVRALPQLPIFPLPGAVLLPHSLVPLHIFEPRYRKMTRDCNAGLKVLALANVANTSAMLRDPPTVQPVVGIGMLTKVEALPDGRFNIVLRGIGRARIRRELQAGEPYRLVEAQELVPDPRETASPDVIGAAQALRQMVFALSQLGATRELSALARLVARARDPGDVADIVAGALLAEPDERQQVLEAVHLGERLRLATQAAAGILARSATHEQSPN